MGGKNQLSGQCWPPAPHTPFPRLVWHPCPQLFPPPQVNRKSLLWISNIKTELLKSTTGLLKNQIIELPCDLVILLLSIPKRIESRDLNRYFSTPVHSSIIHNSWMVSMALDGQLDKQDTLYTGTCCYSVAKSCPTLCDPMDCSPPGSSVCSISQARIPEWAALPFPREWNITQP